MTLNLDDNWNYTPFIADVLKLNKNKTKSIVLLSKQHVNKLTIILLRADPLVQII